MYTIMQLLLTEREPVWGNLVRGREYRPNAVRSVYTTEVKILPYRPTKRPTKLGFHARLKEIEHFSRYRAQLEINFFRCVSARAHSEESP